MGTTEVINCDFMEARSVNMDNSSAEYLPGCLLGRHISRAALSRPVRVGKSGRSFRPHCAGLGF